MRVARGASGCGRAGVCGTAALDAAGPGARSTNDRRSVRGTRDPAPPDHLRRSEQALELALEALVADLADLEWQADALRGRNRGALGRRGAALGEPHHAGVRADVVVAQFGVAARPSSRTTVCSKVRARNSVKQ
jgi:hypothetical protein